MNLSCTRAVGVTYESAADVYSFKDTPLGTTTSKLGAMSQGNFL